MHPTARSSADPQLSRTAAPHLFVMRRYEGATSASASDSVIVNQGGRRGRRGTVIANSMMTATTGPLPAASRRGSFGTTAQPVSAMALSGNPNGRIQIAQVRVAAGKPWTFKSHMIAIFVSSYEELGMICCKLNQCSCICCKLLWNVLHPCSRQCTDTVAAAAACLRRPIVLSPWLRQRGSAPATPSAVPPGRTKNFTA
jgi:hypothetical protein